MCETKYSTSNKIQYIYAVVFSSLVELQTQLNAKGRTIEQKSNAYLMAVDTKITLHYHLAK